MHEMARAFSRACANTGNRIAARIAIIAITTNSSMSVNAVLKDLMVSTLSKEVERIVTLKSYSVNLYIKIFGRAPADLVARGYITDPIYLRTFGEEAEVFQHGKFARWTI